ncbi:MAG: hypothetical protein ACE5Q6_03865, partial [Dehalococcoidia bacterium]
MVQVTADQLRELAEMLPQEPPKPEYRGPGRHSGEPFDLERWIVEHGIEIRYAGDWTHGKKWILARCVWNPEHNDKSAFITQRKSGEIAAGCHHNSCQGKGWVELREAVEPGYRKRRSVARVTPPGANGHKPPEDMTDAEEAPLLTDTGNGIRLVQLHGEDLLYCHQSKSWLTWDSRRWRQDDTGHVVSLAKDVSRYLFQEAARLTEAARDASDNEAADLSRTAESLLKWVRQSQSKDRLSALLWCAQSETGIPILPGDLDADPWLLNCRNGTLDLRTGELLPHRRGDYITRICPVEYDPDAGFALLDDFLERILPDPEVQSFVQRSVGYSLTGLTSEEKLFFAYGPT